MMIFCLFIVFLSLVLAIAKAVQGPNLIDRAAALDVVSSVMVALIVLLGMHSSFGRYFLDLCFLLIGTSFLAVLFLAKIHEKDPSNA